MDTTFSTLAHIALTMAPRLNNRLNAPLFERCGGVENFFRETEPALSALLREARAEHDARLCRCMPRLRGAGSGDADGDQYDPYGGG